MKPFSNKIITASAGTGKTYRLALEYIRIILAYYGKHHDFTLDSILVLTFTRKATAEIRERINEHLALLCDDDPDDEKKANMRKGIIASLWPDRADPDLTEAEKGQLNRALRVLSSDRRQLQVMTIDAYINSVFRNIVRPLRSIESFEIDTKAVEKRLPFLMQHLMKPELKTRLDSLLSRKISPSLDEYKNFFKSLIEQRWLHFQINREKDPNPAGDTLWKLHLEGDAEAREQAHAAVLETLDLLIAIMEQYQPELSPAECTVTGFRKLFPLVPQTYAELRPAVAELCSTPNGCLRLFTNCQDGKVVNGQKFTAKNLAEARLMVRELQDKLAAFLADYLLHTHFLPEQEEIQKIWSAILEEYDKLIYRYKNMTYDDISWFTLEALFSPDAPPLKMLDEAVANEFYQFLSHRSRFILIDEFQDTSLIQFAILKEIIGEVTSGHGAKDFGGAIVVGDEKQSIFGWRGGERDLLLNLRSMINTLSEVKPEPLKKSWRSSCRMVGFVNRVFSSDLIHGRLSGCGLKWPYSDLPEAMQELDPHTRIEFRTLPYSKSGSGRRLDQVYQDFVDRSIVPNFPDKDKKSNESIAVICRTGRELAAIQKLLDAKVIGSIYQPSSTLPEHAWVSPILAWLRWLAWRDWLDFLEVLRSNYVFVGGAELKLVVDEIAAARDEGRDPDLSFSTQADRLYKWPLDHSHTLSQACRVLTDTFLPQRVGTGAEETETQAFERDYLNIHAFLNLAREFELDPSPKDKSIPAFLDYLDDNSGQEFLKQVSVEGSGSLQLLTVHKSKGLQFDRVFLFYNLSSRGGNDSSYLKAYTQLDPENLEKLNDFALTYHYAHILKASSHKKLAESAEYREMLEEMNNLYVAFTRAKTALHLCFAYEGMASWDEYVMERKTGKLKLPLLVAAAAEDFFRTESATPLEDGAYVWPQTPPAAVEVDKKTPKDEGLTAEALARALPPVGIDPHAGVRPNAIDEHKDWKKIWLEDRHNLFGDLIHHYLSFVKHHLPQEHEHALRQCLARFGSLLDRQTIEARIAILLSNLPRDQIFPAGYDKVFTEFPLWHQGRELRLDRLLLDTSDKRALILDYKTGPSREEDQLRRYQQALAELPAIRNGNYLVETAFVDLKI